MDPEKVGILVGRIEHVSLLSLMPPTLGQSPAVSRILRPLNGGPSGTPEPLIDISVILVGLVEH